MLQLKQKNYHQNFHTNSKPVKNWGDPHRPALTKQALLNALEQEKRDVPKDDRLLLRKYIYELKQLNNHDEVVLLLAKCCGDKNTGNCDKKIPIQLRKCAQKIRESTRNRYAHQRIEKQNQWDRTMTRDILGLAKVPLTRLYSNNRRNQSLGNSKISGKNSEEKKIKNLIMPKINFYALRRPSSQSSLSSITSTKNSVKKIKIVSGSHKKLIPDQQPLSNRLKTKDLSPLARDHEFSSPQENARNKKYNDQDQKVMKFIGKHKHTRSRSLQNVISSSASKNYAKLAPPLKECRIGLREPDFLMQSYLTEQTLNKPSSSLYSSVRNSFSKNEANIEQQTLEMVLKKLKIQSESLFDFIIPNNSRLSRSPDDFSITYSQLVNKIITFLAINHHYSPTLTLSSPAVRPFQTQYDLVTMGKLEKFLEQYTYPKYINNQIRDVWTRMEIGVNHGCIKKNIVNSPQIIRVCLQSFKKTYEWKGQEVAFRFGELLKLCSFWRNEISYWQMYWMKDTAEMRMFLSEFEGL